MKLNDIKLNENTSYYVKKIMNYFDMQRNIDGLFLCTYVGSQITEKKHIENCNYLDGFGNKKEKSLEIGRNTLINNLEELRYLLICTRYNFDNGVTNGKTNNKLQKIWNIESLNEDKVLYTHMLNLCERGAAYLYYEIEENHVTIDAMIDVIDELLEVPLDEKFVNEIEL